MIKREDILRILDENGVRYPADFLRRGRSPASNEAQQMADTCIGMIEAYIEYGLNNGFERAQREIATLAEVVVSLCSPTLKPREMRGLKKQTEKSKESIRKEYIRESLSFPEDTVLGISKGILHLIDDTRNCVKIYKEEIASMTEEKYAALVRDAGVSAKDFSAWKEETEGVLAEADDLFSRIAAVLGEVKDDSSALSRSQADAVAGQIAHWRNDIAYSYLLLHSGMNESLRAAYNIAQQWKARITGVGRDNPRAPFAKPYGEKDQMFHYVAAYMRLPK